MRNIIRNCIAVIIIVVFILVYFICFGTAQVRGSSMYPTYKDNDFLFISKLKQIEYGDIVAINSSDLGKLLCKRIIGLSGDHIIINETGLYRNNILLEEDYIDSNSNWLSITKPLDIIVDNNSVFVLGDNRNASTDSRDLGSLDKSEVYGVVVINITSTFGISRQDILKATIITWVLFGAFCIFSRKQTLKNKG